MKNRMGKPVSQSGRLGNLPRQNPRLGNKDAERYNTVTFEFARELNGKFHVGFQPGDRYMRINDMSPIRIIGSGPRPLPRARPF